MAISNDHTLTTAQPLCLPLNTGYPITYPRNPYPVAREEIIIDQVTLDRYYVRPADPVFSYAPDRTTVTLKENILGQQIDTYA